MADCYYDKHRECKEGDCCLPLPDDGNPNSYPAQQPRWERDKKPNIACDRGCGGDPSKCNCWAYRAPAVEPEQPTSVGNAASDPHLAPYCTNPDCVKIVNHDGDCVVEPCEGCPDPELPCKGCPAVEPGNHNHIESGIHNHIETEQPTCEKRCAHGIRIGTGCQRCADHMAALQGSTTNMTPACPSGCRMTITSFCSYCVPVVKAAAEEVKEAERARIELIIEDHIKFCRMDGRDAAASEIEYLLGEIRGGDDA